MNYFYREYIKILIEVGLYIFLMIELLKIEKVYISKGKKGLLGNIRRAKLFRKIIIDINSDFVCFNSHCFSDAGKMEDFF